MHVGPRFSQRALRWLLLVLCAGSVAFAADKSWFPISPFGFGWWSDISPVETQTSDMAVGFEPGNHRAPELSMGGLVHGMLFSKPATTWRLDSAPAASQFGWLTQPESETFTAAPSVPYSSSSFHSSGVTDYSAAPGGVPTAPDGGPPPPPGTWIATASGNWSNPANWKDGIIASGATAIAHFDSLDITTDVTVTLDSSRIIGSVIVGDTNATHRYTISPGSGGERLIFDSSLQTSLLQQTSTSGGDTISVPIALNSDLEVSNLSTAHPFQISGSITNNRFTGSTLNVTFEGAVNVSGNITTGINGGELSLTISGNVNLSGTNTYGGLTFVTGTLFVKGDNSAADGLVQVSGSPSVLSGIGTIGGIVTIQGGTITAGDGSTVGHLTLKQSLTIQATEGGGGTLLANLDGDLSDLISIAGTFNIGSGNTLDIQGSADGTTTYTLATYLSHTGTFGTVLGLPQGYDLVYLPTELDLVPIPEPATWIGGALALAAVGFAARRRNKMRNAKREIKGVISRSECSRR